MLSHKIMGMIEAIKHKNATNISENMTDIKTEPIRLIQGMISPQYLFDLNDRNTCMTTSTDNISITKI
jgi:hypothetical protein